MCPRLFEYTVSVALVIHIFGIQIERLKHMCSGWVRPGCGLPVELLYGLDAKRNGS